MAANDILLFFVLLQSMLSALGPADAFTNHRSTTASDALSLLNMNNNNNNNNNNNINNNNINNNNNNDDATFLDAFSGDFDNYEQVARDRAQGLLPREGGGHEHIHATLVPCNGNQRVAAFYFDANPKRIFRLRYYEISFGDSEERTVMMKLYTFVPELDALLRQESDPMEWPRIVEEFPNTPKVTELNCCDIQWSRKLDPVQHKYAEQANLGPAYHAVMVHGEALVNSTMVPGQKILIRDQISLWDEELWINDRGFNPETMEYIYGNQRGVPYEMRRVTRMTVDGKREVENAALKWTLGEEYRTVEEYEERIDAIEGVTTRLNS